MTRSDSRSEQLRFMLLRSRMWLIPQLTAMTYGERSESAERECERLLHSSLSAGWLRRTRVFARQVPDLSCGPLLRWETDDGCLPSVGSVLWRASSRWTGPPRMQTVWHAGKRLLSLIGRTGDGRIRQPGQASHDLCITQILVELSVSQNRSGDAASWIGEEQFGKLMCGKVPDAMIARPDKLPLAIDFLGNYPADRVHRIMLFYSRLGLPFELW